MNNSYLKNLNESQRQAVLQKDGPMIIIAGAGSGKTRVLTYRTAHLVQQGIDPFNILLLTFTNKAAKEMKERIAKVVGISESKNLWMGTFHSTFAKILRLEADKLGFTSSFTIYDTQDSVSLIKVIIKEMNLDNERYKPKQIYNRISSFKNNLITVNSYFNNPDLQEADLYSQRPKVGEIYKNYVNRCFKFGVMDFDDLLMKTNELLTKFPKVLMKYQDLFRYIMVDEYQDTNHSQYLIVKALADRFQNLCVVGDDNQSIYSFRGANIQNILNFQKSYHDVKTFKLEQNYRSTKNIINAASSLISVNKIKLDKKIWTDNTEGELIKVMRNVSDGEEGRFVAQSIWSNMMNRQLGLNNFCVLYRTNSQSRAVEDALRKKGIKYKVFGGISFYQRKEIKDVLAYLRVLINPNDDEAIKRIINYPARGIGLATVNKLIIAANHYNMSLFQTIEKINEIDVNINSATKVRLQNFINMILSFRIESESKNAFETAENVINKIHIVQSLKRNSTPEEINKIENIQEFLNGIKDFITDRKEQGESTSLASFLEDVSLATDFDSEKLDESPFVSLMTIHQSKGIEYSYVYIVGLEEDLFPSAMSINTRSELEEERRLFYVALTRAKTVVYLSYAQSRYRWGRLIDSEVSRFLDEIPKEYLHFIPFNTLKLTTNKFKDSRMFRYKPKKIRLKKPIELKRTTQNFSDNLKSDNIIAGNIVEHSRFGKGEVIALEGKGLDKKAEIKFVTAGKKKLLLQFAKLNIIK